MGCHEKSVFIGELQCLSHHFSIFDRSAVVGDTNASCILESFKVAETVSAHAVGDTAYGIYLDSCSLCLVDDISDSFGIIAGGLGIRHSQHSCYSACQCRSTACEYILLVLQSRVTEMNVHIKERRHEYKTCTVYHSICGICNPSGYFCDLSFADKDVCDLVCIGINCTDVSDKY